MPRRKVKTIKKVLNPLQKFRTKAIICHREHIPLCQITDSQEAYRQCEANE